MSEQKNKIIFYDGDCGLCLRSIQFIMERDSGRQIYFSPLQGETSKGLLTEELREDLSTIVYRRDASVTLLRSSAVLQALIDTQSAWRIPARLSLLIPVGFRDWVYDRVANNRKRFLKSTCRLPSEDEREQLLS